MISISSGESSCAYFDIFGVGGVRIPWLEGALSTRLLKDAFLGSSGVYDSAHEWELLDGGVFF